MRLKAPFSHYSIEEIGVITILKTRRHSPAGEIIPQRIWRGRLRVKLTDDKGKPCQCWVDRLVWDAFAAEPLGENEKLVFIDGDVHNVHFDNLAVVKRGDRRPVIHPDHYLVPAPQMALVVGTKKSDWKGSANPNAKLDEYRAACIRYFNKRITQTEMAEKLGVSQASISYIINSKTWKHVK